MSNETDGDGARFTDPPRPYVHTIADRPGVIEVRARDLVETARNLRNAEEYYAAAQLERAAKTIELWRLREWEARRQLAVSEAARAAEDADDDDQVEDDEVLGGEVLAEMVQARDAGGNFLAQIAASLPPGTRCSIHLEREHPREPERPAPCRVMPGHVTVTG